jgi:hypothetical protein
MLNLFFNTVKIVVEIMFKSLFLYTLFSQASKLILFYTQLIPTKFSSLSTKLYTFFIKNSSVSVVFQHYSQGLYKLKLIKYI